MRSVQVDGICVECGVFSKRVDCGFCEECANRVECVDHIYIFMNEERVWVL